MTAPHVGMTIRWFVPVERTRSTAGALQMLMSSTRTEPGFVACSVSIDVANTGVIQYGEEWQSEEALQAQFDTDRFRSLLSLVDDATEAPVVEFALADGKRGLEYVQEVSAGRC